MNKIILLGLCAVVAFASVVDAVFDKEKFMAIGAKCKEESGTADEEVKKILQGQAATSTESKCMMACIFKEMGILTSDGKFDVEANERAAKETFSDSEKFNKAKEFNEHCKDRVNAVEDDEKGCERAGVMHACAIERMKELGITDQDFE